MGKFKQKKNKAHRNQPTGLESEKESEYKEMAVVMSPVSGSINNLLQKLQSPSEDERECTCTIIASLTEQPGAVAQLLKAKAVKVIGPQLLANNLTLKSSALGALRNISVEGGSAACEEMVAQDIMTPLVGMFQQFEWNAGDKLLVENQNNMFEQALHLLWNVCEVSETAVSIFNTQNLLQYLIPCFNPECHGLNIAVAAAQCVYAVSDNNPAMNEAMSTAEIRAPVEAALTQQHTSHKQLLLRTLAAGILHASSACQSAAQQTSVLSVLAAALEQDAAALLVGLDALLTTLKLSVEAPSSSHTGGGEEAAAAASMDSDDGPPMDCPEGIIRDAEIKHRTVDEQVEQLTQVLQAQQLALQLLANMCCTDEEGDEGEWEDSGSDGTSAEEDMVEEGAEGVSEPTLTIPSEIHAVFVQYSIPAKVLNKTVLPLEDVCARLADNAMSQKLMKSMGEVEVLALLCLGNLLAGLETQQLGGAEHVHQLWQRLVSMATTQRVCANADLLEAVTNVMHNTVQILAQLDPTKLTCMTVDDVQFLYKLSSTSTPDIRANVTRIVAAIGQALSKQQQPHDMMKVVGEFLLQCARVENNVWLVAEAVDALMDVFAEDHLNTVIQELELIQKLSALAPQLKTKVKQQRAKLGEHLPVVMTVRANLPRFIQYKKKHIPT